jgi:Lon protease-like protein
MHRKLAAMSDLGLFPLRLVLFPGERLPLHVFEPRYRELIAECLEQDAEFGVVLAEDDGLREIGTRAAVVEVLQRFDDGRLNIIVEGRDRFRLIDLSEGRSFHTGAVEPVLDDPDPATPDEAAHALRLLQALAAVVGVDVELPAPGDEMLSFAIAARVELGVVEEQELLELRSERQRLTRICEMLAKATVRAKREREVRERAQTNGKLPHRPTLP